MEIINCNRPVKRGTALNRIPRLLKLWSAVRWSLTHAMNRMLAQLQIRFGTPTDMQLLAMVTDPRTKDDLWDTSLEEGFKLVFKEDLGVLKFKANRLLREAVQEQYRLKNGDPSQGAIPIDVEAKEEDQLSYLWSGSSRSPPEAATSAAKRAPAKNRVQLEKEAVDEECKRWATRSFMRAMIDKAAWAPPYDMLDGELYRGLVHHRGCQAGPCIAQCKIRKKRLAIEATNKAELHDFLLKFNVASFMCSKPVRKEFPLISSIALRVGAVLPACAIVESFFSVTGFIDHHKRRSQGEESREQEVIMKHALDYLLQKRKAAAKDAISMAAAKAAKEAIIKGAGFSTPASAAGFFTPSSSSRRR